MQAGKLNQNMVSALEEAFKYSLEIKDLEKQNKEQEKMIELMAKFINNTDIDEDICKVVGEKSHCDKYYNSTNCIKCVIDYFRKKAKGE